MITILLFVGLPVLFIILVAVAALSLSKAIEAPSLNQADRRVKTLPDLASQPTAGLFYPLPKSQDATVIVTDDGQSVEDLIASVEAQLRHERKAAKDFLDRPTANNLWVN